MFETFLQMDYPAANFLCFASLALVILVLGLRIIETVRQKDENKLAFEREYEKNKQLERLLTRPVVRLEEADRPD
jgi:hypothetical protein